ncbi:glyoxalase/bleomycin resistance protein/dioxygenase [Tricharina praecox]|uniref:glyoxalase/bleomycin resistance protein/dioxygenase n=1 Tax=Tricharina praecox TaxID=43433 RepID=UPI00221F6F3F|nr:glyoxalase/bleomycin resistance protein/dioxygenase [Tricharina praecox]KAI5844938.1 glyoxalase/bleomycin resistance protein/dioxygenase [Tricharina praecox]
MPINHISLTVASLPATSAFYTSALLPLGYKRTFTLADGQVHGFGASACSGPDFWLAGPAAPSVDGSEAWHSHTPQAQTEDKSPREPTGRMHIAFTASSRRVVREFHAAAIKAGGKCNGPPGVRPEYFKTYYGAFVLDPEGRNVEAVCMAPAFWAEEWGMLGWGVGTAVVGAVAVGVGRWWGVI